MRVGVTILPEFDWTPADGRGDQERWRRAEDLGFDHAWIYDHLSWRTLADGPWHATIPTLTAAALATSRIQIGTLVTTPNYRHPVTLAKDLMTIDVMSSGRLTVAVGAGTSGYDAQVLGDPPLTPRQRHERFAEFRQLLGTLLEQPATTVTGVWYSAVDARMIPGAAQQPRPPILVAADGPKGMRLAVGSATVPGDGWVTLGVPGGAEVDNAEWLASIREAARRMEETVEAAGGAPQGFRRFLNMESRVAMVATATQLADLMASAHQAGFTDAVIAWPRPTDPYRADESLLEDFAQHLGVIQAL